MTISIKDQKTLDKWYKKTINIGSTKVIYITNNLIDVFFTEGWEDHVRVKLIRKKGPLTFSLQNQLYTKYGSKVEALLKDLT